MHLISRYPQYFSAYIGISQTSDSTREGAIIREWLLRRAMEENNNKAIRALQNVRVSSQGRISLADLSVVLKWINRFGGSAFYNRQDSFRRLVWTVISFNEYTVCQRINYPRGESFTLRHMYDEVADINLFDEIRSVEVPIFLMHGRHDYQVPMRVAQDYFEILRAPHKEFHIFENSAHGVLIEEPERFNELLAYIAGTCMTQVEMGYH
jgi:pimeloyl-ACP methyl ester carboxylesterase